MKDSNRAKWILARTNWYVLWSTYSTNLRLYVHVILFSSSFHFIEIPVPREKWHLCNITKPVAEYPINLFPLFDCSASWRFLFTWILERAQVYLCCVCLTTCTRKLASEDLTDILSSSFIMISHSCMCVWAYVCVCIHVCVHTYVCVHVCICVQVGICVVSSAVLSGHGF